MEYLERGVEALRARFPISPSENWAHGGYGRKAGVNGLNLTGAEAQGGSIRFRLETPFRWPRNPVVAFRHARPDQAYQLTVNGAPIGRFTGRPLEDGVAVPATGLAAAAR